VDEDYVSRAAIELASRDATRISRSVDRPPLLLDREATPASKARATTKAGRKPASSVESAPANEAHRRLAAHPRLLRQSAANAEKHARMLASQKWVYPTFNFHLTEMFGVPGPYWASGYHTGIDFATAYGTPVVAVGNGTVVHTGWDGPYGNQVRVRLPNGDQVWYNHLSSIEVTAGRPVRKGQRLGRVGETGNAFGYHLHFEYRLASDLTHAVDPLPYFADHGLAFR
jgi:murein DD-endopeptidase MepM/ murein hydrolase activator NlpD